MERASYVKLTQDEWDTLVKRGAELYVMGQVDCEADALRMSNALMPEGRRLHGSPNGIFPSRYKAWGERWIPMLERVRDEKAAMPPATQEIVKEVMQAVLPPPELVAEPVQPAPAVQPSDLLSDLLKGLFLEALESERGQEALRNAFRVRAGVPDMPPGAKPVSPTAPVPQRKRSILIVGLLGAQATEIKNSFGQIFDLRFLGSNDAIAQAKHAMKHVDTVIGMLGWLDHTTTNVLKKAKDFKRVNGTVSELKRVLTGMSNT